MNSYDIVCCGKWLAPRLQLELDPRIEADRPSLANFANTCKYFQTTVIATGKQQKEHANTCTGQEQNLDKKPLNTTIAAVECGRKTFDCVVVQKFSQQFEIRAARRNVPCLFIPMAGQQLLLQIFHLCLDTSHLMFLAEPIKLQTLVVQLGKDN